MSEHQNFIIKRPVYSREKFDQDFLIVGMEESKKKISIPKKIKFFAFNYLNPIGLFTIINLFAEYKFKSYFIPDLLSGITGNYIIPLYLNFKFYVNLTCLFYLFQVGVMHIPAGNYILLKT